MVQPQHAGLFSHSGRPGPRLVEDGEEPADGLNDQQPAKDPFATKKMSETAKAIGLAARASAGFPIAFEPTFVPVHDKRNTDRPDMAEYADWVKDHSDELVLSRFAVDGGVLANTPIQPALEAIRRHHASNKLIRRVLVLIHPHAADAGTVDEQVDDAGRPFSLFHTLTGVAKASASVGSRSYVDEIEKHNELALRWRDGRIITLANFTTAQALSDFLTLTTEDPPATTPRITWHLFRSMRERRGAYVLAHQIRRTTSVPFKQLIDQARIVIEAHTAKRGGVAREMLPFVPDQPPSEENMPPNEWRWGLDLATGIATLATELLRQLLNTNLTPLEEIQDEEAKAGAKAEWTNLLEQANIAWTKSVNAGIRIDALGIEEEKAAESVDIGGDTSADEYARVMPRLRTNLNKYAARMGPNLEPGGDGGSSDGARVYDVLLHKVAEPLFTVVGLITDLSESSDQFGEPGTLLGANPLRDAENAEELLRVMLTVEVISYLLTEDGAPDSGVPSTPIEFVQLSAQINQDFAPDFTSDDKLAGMSLNRFGAFLKRSWRANDWIWGRLDAVKILMSILLTPENIRQLGRYSTWPPSDVDKQIVIDICRQAPEGLGVKLSTGDPNRNPYSDSIGPNQGLDDLYKQATKEVADARAGSDKPMSSLVSLAAYGYQMALATEELPWLAECIQDDQDDGAGGSRSARLLARYQELQQSTFEHKSELSYRMLELFANSGIGQETVGEELPSDLMIRTAATAAASTATMLSSERSGLGFAKPLTGAVRGFVAAPYWTAIGLTHRGQVARIAAATVLASRRQPRRVESARSADRCTQHSRPDIGGRFTGGCVRVCGVAVSLVRTRRRVTGALHPAFRAGGASAVEQ